MYSFPRRLLCAALAVAFATNASAQQAAPATPERVKQFRIVSRYKDGHVQLRWMAGSAAIWRTANRYGYVVERAEMSETGAAAGFSRIASLKPFGTPADTSDEFVRAAWQMVMMENTAKKPGVDAMLEARNDEQGAFLNFVLTTNLSPKAAAAAANSYEDVTAVAGKTYAYRLYIPASKNSGLDTALTIVSVLPEEGSGPTPAGLRAEEEDGLIRLFWNFSANRSQFTGYYVERSRDGGKSFERLTKHPVVFMAKGADEVPWIDSNTVNYVRYQYRISGITLFGDESTPATAIPAMSRDKTPPAPASNLTGTGDHKSVSLTWDLALASPDLKGFIISRAPTVDGPFRDLNTAALPASARSFIDTKPNTREPYYIAYTVDTSGNRGGVFASLISAVDSISPVQPKGLAGTIDSAGRVRLHWNRNGEDDLEGYLVYVANARDNVYRQFGGAALSDTAFTDSVSMRDLNRSIYYKITAVDYSNNPSPYSEALELKRPDVHPPVAAVITGYSVKDGAVTLEWEGSNSRDVAVQSLIRREEERETVLQPRLAGTGTTDSAVTVGKTYSYVIRAKDSAGHITDSRALVVTVSSDAPRPGVTGLKGEWMREQSAARIEWRDAVGATPHQVVLYRGRDEAELKAYRKVKDGARYSDNTISEGAWYYAVKVLYEDGSESALSPSVKVSVN